MVKKLSPPPATIDGKERIPTICGELKSEVKRFPTPSDVEAVVNRINSTKDLVKELHKLKIDISNLSHLIALNLHYKKLWTETHKESNRAKDYEKKTILRTEGSPLPRAQRLKRYVKASGRMLAANEANRRCRPSGKKRFYYDRLLYDLYRIFSSKASHPLKPRPFRYMAAIISLFNLHPENFCKNCKLFAPDKETCKLSRIFYCKKHTQSRDKIYRALKSQTTRPSAKYPL